MLKLHAGQFTIDAAQGEQPRRTISGIAVRYNTEATVSDGTRVMFAPGSIPTDGPAPKLFMFHDPTKVIGTVVELAEVDNVLLFSAKVAETVLGSEALVLASAGALSDVSVGVEPVKFKYDKNGVMVITASKFMELSVVPHGAFDAPILDVAASIHQDEEEVSNNQEVIQEQEQDMSEATEAPAVVEASTITQTLFAQPRKEFKLPSAGEWISAQMQGGAVAAELNARVRAAAPDVVTSDLDGILPLPIVSPIYNNFRGLRPVIDAVGVRAMPQSGKVFIRPVVSTHTSMAVASENTTIQSGTFVVNDVQITKGIYGGYVDVSEASLDWTQPEVLGAMLDDMARVYANTVDNVAADALEAGTTNTNNFTAADIAKPEVWVAWIYQAASDILTGSNGNLPTHLFMAPNRWASLGNLSDDSGRPLFPNIGPMNALGQLAPGDYAGNAFGLQVVVDRNLPSGTLIIGDATSGGCECWEQQKGAISIDVPSKLERTIAFRGYFAAKMIDDTKFIKAAFV
jgi:HK97 family phage prohead protease